MRSRRARAHRAVEPVPATIYSEEYLLSDALEGYPAYLAGSVSLVKHREIDVLDIEAGARVLDVGCGRGDVVAELQRRGAAPVGMDYAEAAVRLTKNLVGSEALVTQADAVHLPFPDDTFDRVLLGDVIEHLPWPLAVQALVEIDRVLVPGGKALIHTSPNTWFVAIVLPPLRLALRVLKRKDVLARFDEYRRLQPLMHPNELSPRTIKRLVREAGVQAETWADRDVLRSGASEWTSEIADKPLIRLVGRVAGAWPFRLIFSNDLYALLHKDASDPGSELNRDPSAAELVHS